MNTQLNNLVELAAQLILDGKATIDNAMQMAIEQDSDRCLQAIEDMKDKLDGYINPNNKTQKAASILMNRIYNAAQ